MINLPHNISKSSILTESDKAALSAVECVPFVDPSFEDATLKNIFQYYSIIPAEMDAELHKYASRLLSEGKVDEAWQVLLSSEIL